MEKILISLLLVISIACAQAAEKPHAVIVVGTHHYSPQKTMPQFANELTRLGFRTTLINPDWDPEKGKRGLPGLEALAEADVAIFFIRFLKLSDEQLAHITSYLESGKPVVGLRTSTHGFNYPTGHAHHGLNLSFGKDALGTPYQVHLVGKTSVELAEGAATHPILTGVDPSATWQSPGTLYLTALEPGVEPLLRGTGKPRKPGIKKTSFGSFDLKAVMTDTIAWTWRNKWGGRTFSTSLGHVGDFTVPQSMRVMVNGVCWAAGKPVPGKNVNVQTFTPAKATPKKAKPKKRDRSDKKAKPAKKTAPGPIGPKALLAPVNSSGLTLFYGNSFIERLQEDGTLEALLHAASPEKRQQFRSLAYTGDEVGFRIRPAKFGAHLGYISNQLRGDRVVMAFGMNEAFSGGEGLAGFSKSLEAYVTMIKGRHPGSEFILVSPTAVAESDTGVYPDVRTRNADIASYCQAMEAVAQQQGVGYVDLFAPSLTLHAESKAPLTSNSLHLNQAGNEAIAMVLAGALASADKVKAVDTALPGFAMLKKMASRKAYEMAMAYKPANGIHYYGLRKREYEFASEIPHHLNLATQLDESIWVQAQDLATAQPFPKLAAVGAKPPAKRPRKGLGVINPSPQDLAEFTVADGYEVNLFASSEEFPELINPLQMQFDGRGRLWVCCFESYPVPVPGTLSDDKILIFEDTDGDGKADTRTVFADHLKLPDGFVLYKDGIIVSVARKLVWLRDTDGDDIADLREEWLRGADDTDTHHGGYLARSPQGHIILNEALFHRGQFETPYGPVRTKNAATVYLDPSTRELSIERQPTHPNPWKISYNNSGDSIQMFGGGQIIDCNFYDVWTPVGVSSSSTMGMPFRDDKGCTIAYVSSPHFPEAWQGGVVTGHLLAKNAVLYTPLKLNAGVWEKADTSLNLISSKNKSFRPTDLEFGLDGALYISDFYYPIIGHAQHSIRDPNRDYTNGRIWRITRKGAPLAKPPKIAGAKIPALFAHLTHPQAKVRELVRLELEKHPTAAVVAYAKSRIAQSQISMELGLELLWLFERTKDFSQLDLFRRVARSPNVVVRRAAARSLRWWAPSLQAEALAIAAELLNSGDARTKISLISAASHLRRTDSAWWDLVKDIEGDKESPIGKMLALAAHYESPSISPEYPLLAVSKDATLSGWKMSSQTAGTLWIKSDEAQHVILGYRGNPYINFTVNGIPELIATGSKHSKDGQVNLTLVPGVNKIAFESADRGQPTEGRLDLYLANPIGGKPERVTFAKDQAEHTAWEKTYEDAFATVTDSRIYIKAVPSQMVYNVTRFTVKAGRTYTFVFENPDHMQHNLVITKPGKAAAVGALADAMAANPDAMEKHYVPDSDLILFATGLVPHGEKEEKEFIVPSLPGDYPYICTFPGHWRIMRGIMVVE